MNSSNYGVQLSNQDITKWTKQVFGVIKSFYKEHQLEFEVHCELALSHVNLLRVPKFDNGIHFNSYIRAICCDSSPRWFEDMSNMLD